MDNKSRQVRPGGVFIIQPFQRPALVGKRPHDMVCLYNWIGAVTMAQVVRVVVALIVGVLFLVPAASDGLAFENVCSANPCPVGQVCVQGFFGPLCLRECSPNRCSAALVCLQGSFGPRCEELRCNVDSECPNSRPRCRNGACQATVAGGGGGGGGGITPSGVGGRCGPQRFGRVVKHVGCQRGLVCMQGTCQRPAT
jgi:hypothetical protein